MRLHATVHLIGVQSTSFLCFAEHVDSRQNKKTSNHTNDGANNRCSVAAGRAGICWFHRCTSHLHAELPKGRVGSFRCTSDVLCRRSGLDFSRRVRSVRSDSDHKLSSRSGVRRRCPGFHHNSRLSVSRHFRRRANCIRDGIHLGISQCATYFKSNNISSTQDIRALHACRRDSRRTMIRTHRFASRASAHGYALDERVSHTTSSRTGRKSGFGPCVPHTRKCGRACNSCTWCRKGAHRSVSRCRRVRRRSKVPARHRTSSCRCAKTAFIRTEDIIRSPSIVTAKQELQGSLAVWLASRLCRTNPQCPLLWPSCR